MKYLKLYNTTQEMQADIGNLERPYVTIAKDNMSNVGYGRVTEEQVTPKPWHTGIIGNLSLDGLKFKDNAVDMYNESDGEIHIGFLSGGGGQVESAILTINYDGVSKIKFIGNDLWVTPDGKNYSDNTDGDMTSDYFINNYCTKEGDWYTINLQALYEYLEIRDFGSWIHDIDHILILQVGQGVNVNHFQFTYYYGEPE